MAFGEATLVSNSPDPERGPRVVFKWRNQDGGEMQIVPPVRLGSNVLRLITRATGIIINKDPYISVAPTRDSDGGAIHEFTVDRNVLTYELPEDTHQEMTWDAANRVLNHMNSATALTGLGPVTREPASD